MKKILTSLLQLFRISVPVLQPALIPAHQSNRSAGTFRSNTPRFPVEHRPYRAQTVLPRGFIQSKPRNSNQVANQGYLRVGLVGFHLNSFIIRACAQITDSALAKPIENLPSLVKPVQSRDIAGGLKNALQMLTNAPHGRTAILVITSGQPTGNQMLIRDFVQTAAKWQTAIHSILLSDKEEEQNPASNLATQSILGYGKYRCVATAQQLNQAVCSVFNSLTSKGGSINSIIVVIDCSAQMQEQFAGTTRLEMVAVALRSQINKLHQNPALAV